MPIPSVVLVEPQIPANLGFIARVLDNFGIPSWAAVRPCAVAGTEAERTGAPARARLDALQRYDTLDEALAGASHVVGFTARQGYHRRPEPLPALPAWWQGLPKGAKVVLLFGREDRGLEEAECAPCSALFSIPTPGPLASLNLSHAVAVVLYALAAADDLAPSTAAMVDGGDPLATHADKARFGQALLNWALTAQAPLGATELEAALQRVLAAPIETRDLRLLWKLLRHRQWMETGR